MKSRVFEKQFFKLKNIVYQVDKHDLSTKNIFFGKLWSSIEKQSLSKNSAFPYFDKHCLSTDKLCFSIEKHSLSKNSASLFVKHCLSTDKLCFSIEKYSVCTINRVYQCQMYNISKNYVFRSINIVFRNKLCFLSKKKLRFLIEKHCLSPMNSVFRFITHLACQIEKHCLSLINSVFFNRKTLFFTWKTQFIAKNSVYRVKSRVSKKHRFQIKNIVFQIKNKVFQVDKHSLLEKLCFSIEK